MSADPTCENCRRPLVAGVSSAYEDKGKPAWVHVSSGVVWCDGSTHHRATTRLNVDGSPSLKPLLVPVLECRSLDCRHDHDSDEECESKPPCILWPGDTDCAGCLGNGTYLDIETARASVTP